MKKLFMIVLFTGITLLVMGGNFSWSQDKKQSDVNYGQAWFNEIDIDGDGKISREEHMNHAKKRAEDNFKRMDTNKDGFLSKEEFEEGMAKKRKKNKRKAKEQATGEKK